MAKSQQILSEWGEGPQPLTPIESHWFSPIFTDGGGNTVVSDPYTTNYNNGSAPYNVTLTDTAIGGNDQAGPTVPIASYATGFNFHIASATLADGDKVIFYDQANGTYPQSSAVDILAQTVDSQGNPVGAPMTLQSDVQNVRQFRVGSAALGGNGYVLSWATVDPQTLQQTTYYQGYSSNGTPVAGDSGTLDSFTSSTVSGESYGFGTLQDSTESNPSFVYLRGSTDNGAYAQNAGVKYETVSTSGQPTSALTFIAPPYPGGSSSPDLLNYSYVRLKPTATNGNDLAIIMRYSYVDASGTTQQALDVHTLNAETGAGTDHVVALASGDTNTSLTQTVLSNGDLAVGYGDGTNDPFQVQVFDPSGRAVGAPLVLPSDEAGFSLDTNDAGQLVVEWTANAGTGQQLDYDIYDVNGSGGSSTSGGTAGRTGISTVSGSGQTIDLQPFADVFNGKQASNTFVFSPGDGLEVIHGFEVGGAGHDTIELPSSDFRNFAAVLRNTGDVGGSAFITDPKTGDAIRLAGVTTAELKAHPKDFAFYG